MSDLTPEELARQQIDAQLVACYSPKSRADRKESERFKAFTYKELSKRDKVNLDFSD